MPSDLPRVAVYVDGFNLYHGIRSRKTWKRYYWVDPVRVVEAAIGSPGKIVLAKYFTARVKGDPEKQARQSAYLDALRHESDAEIRFGEYYRKPRRCFSCGVKWVSYEEKMTDSDMAAQIVADTFLDRFDLAVFVTGDTDIVPAIRMVKAHGPTKRTIVAFPPARKNEAIAKECDAECAINGAHLEVGLLPDTIVTPEGIEIRRPVPWR